MGKFTELLRFLKELRQSEVRWQNKSEFYAVRAMWIAMANLLTILSGITFHYLGLMLPVSIMISFGLGSFLLSIAFLISSWHWKTRQKSLASSDEIFDEKQYLENNLVTDIEKIKRLPISDDVKNNLIEKEFIKYRRKIDSLEKLQKSIKYLKSEELKKHLLNKNSGDPNDEGY